MALPALPTGDDHRLVDVDRDDGGALDTEQCLRLLRTSNVGRLALSVQALPVIVPVNFALDPRGIIVRTGAGREIDQACNRAVVGFEVDGYDPLSGRGWSVLVQGHARVLDQAADLAAAHRIGWTPWGSPSEDTFIEVSIDVVTGRHLGGWYWHHGFPTLPA